MTFTRTDLDRAFSYVISGVSEDHPQLAPLSAELDAVRDLFVGESLDVDVAQGLMQALAVVARALAFGTVLLQGASGVPMADPVVAARGMLLEVQAALPHLIWADDDRAG